MSRRVERVNSLLHREIAKIIDRDVPLPEGVLVTVTRVETSPDLRQARAFVTVLAPGLDEKKILSRVKEHESLIRSKVAPAITFRFLPEILILEDKALIREQKMRRLFAEVESDSTLGPGPA